MFKQEYNGRINKKELYRIREEYLKNGFNMCIHFNLHTNFTDIDIYEGTKKIFRLSAKDKEYNRLIEELESLLIYLTQNK